jgi:hypothetical protein
MWPTEKRVDLITELYKREGAPRQLAQILDDIESSPDVGRREVIDALRSIVPPEEPDVRP